MRFWNNQELTFFPGDQCPLKITVFRLNKRKYPAAKSNFLLFPVICRTASLTKRSSPDDARCCLPPLPVFLPPASWIILTTTTSPTVTVYQRGVQGSIRPWLASSPTIHCSGLSSSSPAGRFLSAAAHRQPASPGDARFNPGRWMAVFAADLHPLVYLIINIFIFLTTPRPPPLSQVTQYYQPCRCRLFHRERWEETRARMEVVDV